MGHFLSSTNRSIAVPKPFVHFAYLAKLTPHSGNARHVQFMKVLVQEFAVKADQGFINALLTLVASDKASAMYSVRCVV